MIIKNKFIVQVHEVISALSPLLQPVHKLNSSCAFEKLLPEQCEKPMMAPAMPGEVRNKELDKVPCRKTCQVSSKREWPTL